MYIQVKFFNVALTCDALTVMCFPARVQHVSRVNTSVVDEPWGRRASYGKGNGEGGEMGKGEGGRG